MEKWLDVVGYEGLYQVSSEGRVKSINKKWSKRGGKILSPYNNGGYRRIRLGEKAYLVHRLVAAAFIPNPENKPEVNHINAKTDDNRLFNLEWCTREENKDHAVRMKLYTGDHMRGELNQASILSDKLVIELRSLNSDKIDDFCGKYKIPKGTALRAYRGFTWTHLPCTTDLPVKKTQKLTIEDVKVIKLRLSKGEKHSPIAKDFGVHPSCISKIATGLRYSSVRV